MYPTLIGLMFAAKLTVMCLYPSLFNIIWWYHTTGGTSFHSRNLFHYVPWV